MMKPLFSAILLSIAAALPAFSYDLVKDGQVRCAVVRSRLSTSSDIYACKELAKYIGRITGTEVPIVRRPAPGKYNLYPGWLGNSRYKIPDKGLKLTRKIKDDGFVLYADDSGLYITARHPRGVLYGVYEVLKRCGDIRWIHPGPDGEFFTLKKDFVIPAFRETVNPSFKIRCFNLIAVRESTDTPVWQVRNNMHPWANKNRVGKISHLAPECDGGGHIFSSLIPDTYFSTRPELYGLYKGRRLPQCGSPELVARFPTGGQSNQPCTSNPETIRIMCEGLAQLLRKHPEITYFTLFNNDSPSWCECENCRRLDPPEERMNGQVPTRYWMIANKLAEAGKKVRPDVDFIGTAYQNRHDFPLGTGISPAINVKMAPNNRCYTHHMFDESCVHNRRFRESLLKFEKTGRPIELYEYMNFLPCGSGGYYIPLGRFVAQELKDYHRHGYAGWCDEVLPWDGSFIPNRETHAWQKNVLDEYIKAYFLWNADADYDTVEDDIGSRYYGKAWSAMKEYRRFLADLYENLNDHLCMGSEPVDLGRALERPGSEARLEALLARALELASGDRRVTALLEEERRVFRGTFVEKNRQFRIINKDATIAAAPRGKGLEAGIKYADYVPEIPMEVRFLYDDRGLYAVHNAGGPGSELELTDGKQTRIYKTEKAGEEFFPLTGLLRGTGLPLGVRFRKDGRTYSWTGPDALTGAPSMRLLSIGRTAVFSNGSFEHRNLNQNRQKIKNFWINAEIITGDAAAGRTFLRGTHISGDLKGLNGYPQTYVPKIPFRGKLRFSIMARGHGNLGIELKDHMLPKGIKHGNSQTRDIPVSQTAWTPVTWEMDCSRYIGNTPYLVLHFMGLDIDCLSAAVLE